MLNQNDNIENTEADQLPLRSQVRKMLINNCPRPSDLDAFISDNFPSVYREFSNGMDSTTKITHLLQLIPPNDVFNTLQWYLANVVTHQGIGQKELSGEKSDTRCVFLLAGEMNQVNRELIHSITEILRKVSKDVTLTITEIKHGSIKLIISSTIAGCIRIIRHYRTNKTICGIQISKIYLHESITIAAKLAVFIATRLIAFGIVIISIAFMYLASKFLFDHRTSTSRNFYSKESISSPSLSVSSQKLEEASTASRREAVRKALSGVSVPSNPPPVGWPNKFFVPNVLASPVAPGAFVIPPAAPPVLVPVR